MIQRTAQTSAGRQALTILALLFFLAGLSRLGLGVADVIAAETDIPAIAPDTLTAATTDALLLALQAREAKIQADEADIANQKSALADAQAELRQQLDKLALMTVVNPNAHDFLAPALRQACSVVRMRWAGCRSYSDG
jgi:hypothetical protein